MAYPDNLVQEGETVALDLRPHWWYFSRNILTGIPLAIVLILVLSADADWVSKYGGLVVGLVAVALGGVAGAEVPGVAHDLLRGHQPAGHLPQRRDLEARGGDPARAHQQHQLPPTPHRPHHRAGDLDIESAGKDGQSHFDFIRHPDGVQHEIYRQMEARNMPVTMVQQAPALVSPAQPGAAVPEQIEQLARLRDQGHITEAEFEAKKSELLGRM